MSKRLYSDLVRPTLANSVSIASLRTFLSRFLLQEQELPREKLSRILPVLSTRAQLTTQGLSADYLNKINGLLIALQNCSRLPPNLAQKYAARYVSSSRESFSTYSRHIYEIAKEPDCAAELRSLGLSTTSAVHLFMSVAPNASRLELLSENIRCLFDKSIFDTAEFLKLASEIAVLFDDCQPDHHLSLLISGLGSSARDSINTSD